MYQVYKVLDDDTLDSLALRMNTTASELVRLNGVSDFNIGDLIVVPSNDLYFSYIVKQGDSLYSIAKEYDQDIAVLYAINGIKEGDYIYPNQDILIPRQDVSVYMTKDDDTLQMVSNTIGVSMDDILKDNSSLSLMPEQIIVYKRV